MSPRCPIGRETELAGLGRREGLEGWSPLSPAGAVDRKGGVRASSSPFPLPALPSFLFHPVEALPPGLLHRTLPPLICPSQVLLPLVPPSQSPHFFLPSPESLNMLLPSSPIPWLLTTHSCWFSLLSLACQNSVIGSLSSLMPFCSSSSYRVAASLTHYTPSTILVWECPAFPLSLPRCLSLLRPPPVLPLQAHH